MKEIQKLRPALLLPVFLILIIGVAEAAGPPWVVTGRVLEKGSRAPLPGQKVVVQEAVAVAPAVSAADGSFEISLPSSGTWTLTLADTSPQQVQPQHIEIDELKPPPHITFYVQPDFLSLPPITISAERDEEKAGKKFLSKEDIHRVPGSLGDPLKALQSLPGVSVADDSSSNPAVRGTGPQDNFYYVDGAPVGYLFHMGDLVSVFNSDLVEDFTVHSAAFGPENDPVIGAVIDVALRAPRTDRWGGKLNLSTLESDVLVEGPVNKTQSLYVAGRRSYLDFLLSHFSGNDEINIIQFPEFYDYQAKYLWQTGSRSTLEFVANGAWDKLALEVKPDSDIAAHDPDLAGRVNQSQSYHEQGAAWTWRPAAAVTNRLQLTGLANDFDLQLATLGIVKLTGSEMRLRNDVAWDTGHNHKIETGVKSAASRINADVDVKVEFPSDFDPDVDNTSAQRKQNHDTIHIAEHQFYLRDRWSALPRWRLLAGARLSMNSYLNENLAEPWAGTEWDVTNRTLVSLLWGRYHQMPEIPQTVREFGNPDINSLRAEHTVLGLRQMWDRGWSGQLEGYVKRLWNLTVPDNTLNYINGAHGRAAGVEMLLKKERTYKWSGWLSVSYSQSTRQNDVTGQKITYSQEQPWIANLVLTRQVTSRFYWGLQGRYHTGLPYTPVVGTFTDGTGRLRPLYAEVNSQRLPDYYRIDLRFSRDFLFNRFKLMAYLDFINVTGHNNVSGYSYNSDFTAREAVYQLPFLPSFGVTMEF